jgi:nucleotide-binding universal stress UspA family protein
MIALKNVLVATDFSEPSDAALAYGRELARAFGSTLHVLHVVENLAARAAADAYPMMLPEMQREIEDAAWKRLEAMLTSADRKNLGATPAVRTGMSPAAGIVEYAREKQIDLIVMGTHGRGAVAHLLMGSVAERVVRTAPCPVLTVRHPEHEFVVPDAVAASVKA